VVFNHFGLDSEHTPSLSMWCFDGPCAGGGIYFSPEPATPFGPRPAFGTPEVHALILDALHTWFADYHADGLRWDSAIATRTTGLDGTSPPLPEGARLLKDVNVAMHALDPAAITVAEDLQEWAPITEPVDPSQIDTYDSGYGFDSQWDDGFYYALLPLLTSADDSQRDVTTLVTPLTGFPPMQRVVYTEDHDKVAPQNGSQFQRIPTLIGTDDNDYYAKRRSGLGLAMVLTTPAVPMLFMGQEFLETLPFPFSPGQALDWSNEQTFAGFRQMIADLIALRENTAGLTAGLIGNNIEMYDVTNTHNGNVAPSIVFHRWAQGGAGDDVVVAANFSNTPLDFTIGFPQPGTWQVRFNSDDTMYSPDFTGTPSTPITTASTSADGQPQSGQVQLGPYSVVILSQ
jgi:1,4-alpha-glucan branching enzyme